MSRKEKEGPYIKVRNEMSRQEKEEPYMKIKN